MVDNDVVWKMQRDVDVNKNTKISDFSTDKHVCKISREVWPTKAKHDAQCKYTYCKFGWKFSTEK